MTGWGDIFTIEKLVAFLLILFRVGGMFIVAPLFSNRAIPPQLKIAFCVMLAISILPLLKVDLHPLALTSDLYLMKLIVQEITIGVFIGLVAFMIFATIQTAGEILGMKVGFSIASIIDPANQGASNIISSLYIIFGSLIFLYLDGHHAILGSVVQSFRIIPLGESFQIAEMTSLGGVVTQLFVLAIKIAAPIIVVLTMLNFLFGFITKLAPQMNIYFTVGFILSPVVGIITLIATLPLFRYVISGMTENMGPEIMNLVMQLKGA